MFFGVKSWSVTQYFVDGSQLRLNNKTIQVVSIRKFKERKYNESHHCWRSTKIHPWRFQPEPLHQRTLETKRPSWCNHTVSLPHYVPQWALYMYPCRAHLLEACIPEHGLSLYRLYTTPDRSLVPRSPSRTAIHWTRNLIQPAKKKREKKSSNNIRIGRGFISSWVKFELQTKIWGNFV